MGLVGWASSTGAGVDGGVMLSKARACWVVSEENSKVARVAWDVMDLKDSESELGISLKMFLAIRSFRLEKKGRGGSGAADLVVLGVGGECRILVP